MPAMMSKLYHALLNAGVDEAMATAAAEEAAIADQRFTTIEQRFTSVDQRLNDINVQITAIKGELIWIRWMVGTNIVLILGVLWKLLR